MDKDLASIQEARELVRAAHEAWLSWSRASQEQVDRVCAAMAEAGRQASERLGRMAQEETGYGVALHKKLKNEFGSRMVWESIRDLKTVGVIRQDAARRLYEIAWPLGVVAALVPSTNPTSTAFFSVSMLLSSKRTSTSIPALSNASSIACRVGVSFKKVTKLSPSSSLRLISERPRKGPSLGVMTTISCPVIGITSIACVACG